LIDNQRGGNTPQLTILGDDSLASKKKKRKVSIRNYLEILARKDYRSKFLRTPSKDLYGKLTLEGSDMVRIIHKGK
jgi:hypothetical protein